MEWLVIWFYLIDVIDTLNILSGLLALAAAVFAGMAWLVSIMTRSELRSYSVRDNESAQRILLEQFRIERKIAIVLTVASVLLTTINVLAPSRTTMERMLAAKALVEVVNTDAAKRIIPKSVELIERYLDKALRDDEDNGR